MLNLGLGLKLTQVQASAPPVPPGYVLIVDNDGSYVVDSDGSYLIEVE